jgi:hypothetical protein
MKKNWAVGFEISEALKRDPATAMSLGLTTDRHSDRSPERLLRNSNSDATLHASLGRYLAGDIGGSLSLTNRFPNGAILEGFMTATNQNDPDPYGGRTNVFSGLRIMVPLGDTNYLPNGSRVETVLAPLGRNAGQKLDLPLPSLRSNRTPVLPPHHAALDESGEESALKTCSARESAACPVDTFF